MQGLSIMVFVADNEASQHAVNLAVALARPDVDTIHVMHACSNDGATPDAQKLMARYTQGLGPKINSEVTVSCCLYDITLWPESCCCVIMHSVQVVGMCGHNICCMLYVSPCGIWVVSHGCRLFADTCWAFSGKIHCER